MEKLDVGSRQVLSLELTIQCGERFCLVFVSEFLD